MALALEGRIALVTGAAQGIGAACARRFLDEGAQVVIADLKVDAAEALADQLGPSASHVGLDVRESKSWKAAIDVVEARHGRLDVLINCAGVVAPATIEKADDDHWRMIVSTNLDSIFFGCREALRLLKVSEAGAIVNVASALGLRPKPDFPAYAASKGGVRAISKSIALHCAREGYAVRCNSVFPGSVNTPMTGAPRGDGLTREEQIARSAAGHPMRRIAQPEEVAAAILFLASSEASFITGAELTIDGGLTI